MPFHLNKIFLLGRLAMTALAAHAKRLEPYRGDAVDYHGVRYSCAEQHDAAHSALVVQAQNVDDHRMLWKRTLHAVTIDPTLERDVQGVYPESMEIVGAQLHVVDEQAREYFIDLHSGLLSHGR